MKRSPQRSSSKKINPYKACIYGLCRDFLNGNGYDLGTNIYLRLDTVVLLPNFEIAFAHISVKGSPIAAL